jgi:hypothetical protein
MEPFERTLVFALVVFVPVPALLQPAKPKAAIPTKVIIETIFIFTP